MSKIRAYEVTFNDGKFNLSDTPYGEGNFPSSGYHNLKGNFIPLEVEAKTGRVFLFIHPDLNEFELKKLKDDWEQSDKNV